MLATGFATAMPAVAQDALTRQGGETAMEMAIRVGVCDGAGITNAEFVENGGTQLRVQCAGGAAFDGQGMAGGLGTGGVLAAGVLFIGVVAAAGSSSGT